MNGPYNLKLGYLRAMAIILVVLGHSGNGSLNFIFDWFPPYSFQLSLFFFVSGYSYNDALQAWRYIKKSFNRLVIQYYAWNILYAAIFLVVTSVGLLVWRYSVNLDSFFVQPWIYGNQYLFNLAAWFVLALFLVQAAHVLLRRVLGKLGLKNEFFLFGFFLALGLLGTYLASIGYPNEYYMPLGRTLFGLPLVQLGYLYRAKLEKYDKPTLKLTATILAVTFVAQILLLNFYDSLTYVVLEMNFDGKILQPYLSSFTGILLCLQLAKILAVKVRPIKLLRCIGDNSWIIMINHFLGFWLLTTVFYVFNAPGFDVAAYKTDIYYNYLPFGNWQFLLVYTLAGIFFALAFGLALSKFWCRIKPKLGSIKQRL